MITQASGVPNIKTDGAAVLTLYSKKWNKRYWESDILPAITTSEYFKDLSKGDQVEITADPTVTIKAYENGQTIVPSRQTLTKISVVIDKAAYFSEVLTDVDAELSHLDLANKYLDVGVRDGSAYVHEAFFTAMQDAAHTDNKGATAGIKSGAFDLGTSSSSGYGVTTANVVKYMTAIYTVLSEQKIRDQRIWCVIPPWMHWKLMNSELKNAMNMGDPKSILRTGYIGKLAGQMDIYTSTYLPGTGAGSTTPTSILAGTMEAIAYTMRLQKTEKYRDPNFQNLLQGLMVWGYKAVKPEALVNGWVYSGSEA
jgi:hypothetical protein